MRDEGPAPEVDRYGGERHGDCLQRLEDRVAARDAGGVERQPGEGRVDEAEEVGRRAEDPEVSDRVEAAPELRIDDLVRDEPRARDLRSGPGA